MEAGNSREIAVILKQYRLPNGVINYPTLFSIPMAERLPVMFEKDFLKTTALVVAALAMAFDKMGGKKISGELINNLAEEILDTCGEDALSIEDLMLFLQNMVRGKYGNVDNMSVPKFMNTFNDYRNERWNEAVIIRDEKIAHWQGLGDAGRTSKSDPLSSHMSSISGQISDMKKALSETKHENNILKQADKFYGK